MADIFVSYSRTDRTRVAPLVAALEAEGWSVWWDPEIAPGQEFDTLITTELRAARAVIVVWTPVSVESRWVRGEARVAADRKVLVPVRFDAAELPLDVRAIHTTDLDGWLQERQCAEFQELSRALSALVPRPESGSGASPVRDREERGARVAICVLPFANMSGESEQEYFADGISEDIITDLSKVSALWVAARNTAFMFKGKHVDVPQVARQLKVGHVLEGSVRKAGGRVRITAQLIDASGGHVWAERYDRDLNDIFALQDEISQAIVKALKIKLLPEEKQAIERRGTSNAEAYELFLMARQFERTGSERMKPVIVRICRNVVELDPGFARAWALMSVAEAEASQRVVAGFSFESARASAERAVALDPTLAEGHAALGEALLRGPDMDVAAAQPSIETALKLDPNCYDAHLSAGSLCLGQRRYQDAVRHYEAAIAFDADAYRPAGMAVQAYEALGDEKNALAASRRCLERCEKILRVEPDHGGALGFFVTSLADLGEADRARAWAKRAVLFDPDNLRLRYNLACALSKLRDADTAIELLAGVLPKVNAGWLHWTQVDTSLDPIRDDPRYKALIVDAEARLAGSPKEPKNGKV